MFGYIIPNFKTLKEGEKSRYQSVYCGLCHSLRDNYSNISRLALSYDLTFLVLLLSSLYEPSEATDNCNCIFHPGDKYETVQNEYSDYCADITVALAYHKILDDVNDEGKLRAKIGEKALREQYQKVKAKLPDTSASIEKYMEKINELEMTSKTEDAGDEIAKNFGMIMAKIFAFKNDNFSETLAKMGAHLGRLIYFMDAAIDYDKDIKSGAYNPYVCYLNCEEITEDKARDIKDNLKNLAGDALAYFEKLPLEQDSKLLQNILYEGLWIQFNHTFFKKDR